MLVRSSGHCTCNVPDRTVPDTISGGGGHGPVQWRLSDLKVKKAMAELTEMASGMVTKIGGAGDTLDRLHGMVEEEREKAAGRVRVAKDSFNTADIQMKEVEQRAMADQALADFAAREGIALDPKDSVSTPSTETEGGGKTMGPVSQ